MWPADAWKAAPVKSGSLVLIHGQVLKVAKQWSSAFAKVTALSTNIVFFCDKTRQWSNSGGIKRESSALSSSDVRLVQLIIVQVAHKSERNLSSSSRHAYTFHVIGQTVGYHQDGDDENLSYSFVFFTLTEMEGSFYASKNWLQVMKNCIKKTTSKPRIFTWFHSCPPFALAAPCGWRTAKTLQRRGGLCSGDVSIEMNCLCSRDLTIERNFFRQELNKLNELNVALELTPAWHHHRSRFWSKVQSLQTFESMRG